MGRFLTAAIFLLGTSLILADDLSENCPEWNDSSLCKCSHGVSPYGAGTNVVCRNVQDQDVLKEEIRKFRGYHIDYLKLSKLHLPYLPAGLFLGTFIARLHIEESSLGNLYSPEHATPSPFEGLEESVEEIYFVNTKEPSRWYWPDMKQFKKFRKLVIQNSPIDFVGHNFAEIGGGSLESIAVRHSKVNRIHPQAFPELTNLMHADFEGNNLPYLVRTMFPNPAPKLEILNFRDNRLFTLNENMFENMPALVFLDLSRNDFKKFENVVFSSLWNQLQFLFLSGNPFECGCTLAPLKERLLSGSLPRSNDVKSIKCNNHGDFRKIVDLNTNSLQCY